jgi:N-acetylated-alpha-linked acidic dipeptidase
LKDKQDEFAERNLELEEGVFTAMRDPHQPTVAPPSETIPPFMNFAPLKNSIELLKASAERYSKALGTWRAKGSPALSPPALAAVNADLLRISRLFLNPKGLPERPWFKNQIYAPGAYTGYDARPIAAVREYMDEKKWKEADGQVPQVAEIVANVASGIRTAADELEAEVAGGR